MISEKLKQHILYSKTAAAANKAKGNRHIDILSSLYSDASHFIEELLQNADDACLKKNEVLNNGKCSFILENKILRVSHNGCEFDEDDIISITTIGQTTKINSPEINLTGKFGLGFKSIFAICNEPEIHSGKFNFKITDFEVPQFLSKKYEARSETSFIFPLKDNKKTFSIVKKGLSNISYRHLLFTKCIRTINVCLPQISFILTKKTVKTFDKHLSIVQISNNRHPDMHMLFLLFKITLPNNKFVQTAFLISDLNNFAFISVKNEAAFVLFPTLFQTGLKFLINAPFTTTPTREQIPFDEAKTPENFLILKFIKKGFSGLMQLLKKHKLLNATFFSLIPFDIEQHKNNPLAFYVAMGFIEEAQTNAVWPSVYDKFFYASKMLVCQSQIQQLISETDVKILFNRDTILNHEVAKIIPNNLQSQKPFSLFKFADEKDFAFAISSRSGFLKKKNSKWHSSFLTFISLYPDLWSKAKQDSWFNLRKKRFILLNNLSIACPFHENEAVVFLYDKTKRKTPMVHRELMAKPEIVDFFKQLGLPDPDEMFEFRKIVNYIFSVTEITLIKLTPFWVKILKLYYESNESIRMQMIENLKKLKLVPATDSFSENFTIAYSKDVYFNSFHVETFLKHTNHLKINPQFLENLNKKGISYELSEDFFTKLGVQQLPALRCFDNPSRIKEFETHKKEIENKGFIVVSESVTDYELHGLDDFFKNPSREKSLVLAYLVSNNCKQAIYKVETYTQNFTFYATANFKMQLSQNAWLYDTDGLLNPGCKTSGLHTQYHLNNIKIEKICKLAGIQIQLIDFCNKEIELILKLRNIRHSPEQQEQIIREFVDMTNYDTKEAITTKPLVIDYLNFTKDTTFFNHNSKKTILPDSIIFPECSYIKFFSEHPLRIKAENIAIGVLNEKFQKKNVQQHKSMKAGLFQVNKFNNNKKTLTVIISGISHIQGLFVFPQYPELLTESPCLYVAVDNIGNGTPVVYLKMFDCEKKNKTPYFVLPM